MSNESNGVYITADTSLAAYLYYMEVPLLGVEPRRDGKGSVFIFKPPPNGYVDTFQSCKGSVAPLVYYRAYKSLVKRAIQCREAGSSQYREAW